MSCLYHFCEIKENFLARATYPTDCKKAYNLELSVDSDIRHTNRNFFIVNNQFFIIWDINQSKFRFCSRQLGIPGDNTVEIYFSLFQSFICLGWWTALGGISQYHGDYSPPRSKCSLHFASRGGWSMEEPHREIFISQA